MKVFAPLVLAFALMCGCAPKPSLVGTWEADTSVGPAPFKGTFDFGPDMTFKLKASGSVASFNITYEANGTYTLQDKTMTMTTQGSTFAGVPAQFQGIANKVLEQVRAPVTYTLEWKDADTVIATTNGKANEFRRVKK